MRTILVAVGLSALSLGCGVVGSKDQANDSKNTANSTASASPELDSSAALDAKAKAKPKPVKPKVKMRSVTIQGVVRAADGSALGGDKVRVKELGKATVVGWVGKYKISVTIPTTTKGLTLCASTYGYFDSCEAVAVSKALVKHDFRMNRNPAIVFPPPSTGTDGTGGSTGGAGVTGASSCTTSGVFTNCNDGSTCTNSGVFTNCSGGSTGSVSCTHSGVFTNCSNGVTCTHSGVFTNCSDGSTCTTSGPFTNCSGGYHPTGS